MSTGTIIIGSISVLILAAIGVTMAVIGDRSDHRKMRESLKFPYRRNHLDQMKPALLDDIAQWLIQQTNLEHQAEYGLLREQIDAHTVWIFDETIPREQQTDTTRVTARGEFHWNLSDSQISFSIPWTTTCRNKWAESSYGYLIPHQIWIKPDWNQANVQITQAGPDQKGPQEG